MADQEEIEPQTSDDKNFEDISNAQGDIAGGNPPQEFEEVKVRDLKDGDWIANCGLGAGKLLKITPHALDGDEPHSYALTIELPRQAQTNGMLMANDKVLLHHRAIDEVESEDK